jgi:YidC/Oxa1 family membrane protein insertase
MLEHKNTIIAIVLSLAVMVGWQILIGYPQMKKEEEQARLKQQEQSQVLPGQTQPGKSQTGNQANNQNQSGAAGPAPEAPGLPNATAPSQAASRESVIGSTPRIAINTPRLGGSIDLKGGRIDDLTLTQYRETIDPHSPPIVLFSPSGAPDAYYAEFGWVPAAGSNTAMPGPDTVWRQEGTGTLGIDHPVTLTYDNGQGLVFTRVVSIDDRYMFGIKDSIANKGSAPVTLFPYGLVSRHGTPETLGYYILHEGLIGVIGEHGEQTETYKKMQEKKSESWDATNV